MIDGDANILGALALAVTDGTSNAVLAAGGGSRSEATALSALYHLLAYPSVERIRQVLGLTHSGTVRLLDELEAAGHITREPGIDARSRAVRLTPAGRRAAKRVAGARAKFLNRTLMALSADERETWVGLVARVLTPMKRGPGAVRWICRLCDTKQCGRDCGRCPLMSAPHRRAPAVNRRSSRVR